MRAYAASGEPARALHAYHQLRGFLADELGLDPAPATRELFVTILRGETSPNSQFASAT
jgi:DNA-binding SARP family transcriptional activator